jgi:hypothetical protein
MRIDEIQDEEEERKVEIGRGKSIRAENKEERK